MNRKLAPLVVTAFILHGALALVQTCYASASLMDTYMEEGRKLIKQDSLPQAEKQLEMALQNSNDLPPDSLKLADLLDSLGQCYCKTGKLAKAEELLKRAMAIREKGKKDDLKMFMTLMALATVYRNGNKFTESEALYKRGLAMFEGNGPIKTLCRCTVLTALGSMYVECDKPAEAETLLRKAVVMRDSSMFKSALASHVIHDTLGRALNMQGKSDEAEKEHLIAIENAKKVKDESGLAFAEGNLGSVYLSQQKYDKANQMYEDARVHIEKIRGADSVDAATIYSNLALVAINQDRYTDAESWLKKALAVHEKHLGAKHTNVAYDLGKLADVYRSQGKYAQASETAERALKILLDCLGHDSRQTAQAMSTLATVYRDEQQYDKAEALWNDAIKAVAASMGDNHRDIASFKRSLASIATSRGNTAEAKALLEQAAEILAKDKNAEPLTVASVDSELAQILKNEGNNDKAIDLLHQALTQREKVFGTDNTKLLADLRLLAKLEQQQGKTAQLTITNQRISNIEEKYPQLKLTTSKPAASAEKIEVASSADVKRSLGDKWALVVGISSFADPELNLKYAAKDAIDFANFLKTDGHFAADHVKVLSDAQATRDNIIKQLGTDWLGRLAHKNDLVVIYVSSHGSVSRDEAGGVNFLVAHDTQANALLGTGIPMQWLSQIIKEQVHSDRIVLILDVCHSGAVSAGQKGLARDNLFNPGKIDVGSGQAIICSSAPDQVSWESKNYANSVFTRRLIEALKQGSTPDLNKAYEYLKEQVEAEVLRDRGQLQTPLLFSKQWLGAPPVLSAIPDKPQAAPQLK